MIQDGHVKVNGELETRRGRKLRNGDVVQFQARTLTVSLE